MRGGPRTLGRVRGGLLARERYQIGDRVVDHDPVVTMSPKKPAHVPNPCALVRRIADVAHVVVRVGPVDQEVSRRTGEQPAVSLRLGIRHPRVPARVDVRA